MHLLVISQYFWPENFKINDLVNEVLSRGHKVTILTGVPNYPDGFIFKDYKENPMKYSNFYGADVIRVPIIPRGKNNLSLLLNYMSFALNAIFIGFFKLRKKRFDSILVYEPSPITVGIPSAFFRYTKKIPVIFWVQDLWPDSLKAVGVIKSKIILSLTEMIVTFVYKNCDLILSQSKSFIPEITKYAPKNTNIEYFPGWSETIFESFKITQLAKEINNDNSKFNIIFAGNIGEAQDFPAILNAAELIKHLTNIRWYIIGDGRKSDWVKKQIKLRNLEENVIMLGKFEVNRMPSFFKHADALLVSLKDEPIFSMTIPTKILSYLRSGIPIIGMLNGEGADLIKENKAGFFSSAGDYHGLTEIIKNLVSMPSEQRNLIGKNGINLSNKNFNRTLLMNKLESWLLELVDK
jgi:glycosyltransferase involved in cell wall biosynthesis